LNNLLIFDGYNLLYRAFYAIPPRIHPVSREPLNATFGFTGMLLSVLEKVKPSHVAVAFDPSGVGEAKSWRHVEFPGYKANRKPMPDELRAQLPRVREVLRALHIPVVKALGLEADDIVAGLVSSYASEDLPVRVVSNDRDLLQLVAPYTRVLSAGAKFADLKEWTLQSFADEYGFSPCWLPDYKALAGDSSDEIPGVPGLGPVTAKALIQRFRSVETLIEECESRTADQLEMRPKVYNAVKAATWEIRLYKKLATLQTGANLDFDLSAARFGSFELGGALRLLEELRFSVYVNRLSDLYFAELTEVA
jgi:DNA polymerase-1